jgi:hypothetical protein
MAKDGVEVPKVATLNGFGEAFTKATGIDIKNLQEGDAVKIVTQNSVYDVKIVDPFKGLVDVKGTGDFFLKVAQAHLNGSTIGDSAFLKQDWITLDFSTEFFHNGKRIITSFVREIFVNGIPILKSSSEEIH